MLFHLDNVTKTYGPVTALRNLSVAAPEGAVGLLGPNGAGKTTLIRTLLGLIVLDHGEGTVLDLDIRTRRLDIRQRVGFVPEDECLFPALEGIEFVAYAGELAGMVRKDAMQRAHEVLDYVGLGEARYRRVESYSTGMKQRLKLGSAIVHDPRLLILDEPTNGMDPAGRQEVLEAMPPYQGGGEMILNVDFQKSTWKHAPHRFEAGTPDISGAIGLHAAMDYLDKIGRPNIAQHDQELGAYAFAKLSLLKGGIRLFGPHIGRAGLVSFLLKDIHAHDVVTVADQRGVALRGGHHCNQPLMRKLGVESTARASFYFYNTTDEIDRFVEVLGEIQKFFGT